MPKLHVSMYRPVTGNYEHWALYLENGTTHTIYEVVGESPHFRTSVISGKPTSTARHTRTIFVYDVNSVDLEELKNVIASVSPDNSVSHWNCQDYVMEVLEKLEEECIVDGEDKAYIAARNQVKKHFGPV